MAKNVVKSEDNEKVNETPITVGISDTTKGLIIGGLVVGLIAVLVILLIVGQKDKEQGIDVNEQSNGNNNYSSTDGNNTSGSNNNNNENNNSTGENNSGSTNSQNTAGKSEALIEFYEYFESDKKTLIVFASSQCSYCVMQEPIVHAIAEEFKLNYLYMDYLELSSDAEINQVIDELGIEGSTPTSVIVQNGKVITSWAGYVDGKTYVNNLVEAGMLAKGSKYDLEDNITSIDYSKFKSLLNGDKVSAVIIDMPTCGLCYTERLALNKLAYDYEVKVYQLSSESMSQDDMDDFIDNIGKWGYTDEAYEEDQSVQVPLLLFIQNGKIVDFNLGYVEGETDLVKIFKDAGVIKK